MGRRIIENNYDDFDEAEEEISTDKNYPEDYYESNRMGSDMSEYEYIRKLTDGSQMWAMAGNGENFFPCEKTAEELPKGQYLVRYCDSRGLYFSRKTVNLDELIDLPDTNSDRVLKSIQSFWTREEKFREFGFLWKRGVMLYGPPGSGKTSTVQQLSRLIVNMNGIALYCTDPKLDAEGLRVMRNIEPHRPIIVIMEDIDALIDRYGEAGLLAMLDGELQVDNVVFIATTNYPEKLDKRFVNRPSRFDEVIRVGMPSPAARERFLTAKNPRLKESPEELAKWVEVSDGFSIAHMKELISSVECLGNGFDDTVNRLQTMNRKKVSSDEKDNMSEFGIGINPEKNKGHGNEKLSPAVSPQSGVVSGNKKTRK